MQEIPKAPEGKKSWIKKAILAFAGVGLVAASGFGAYFLLSKIKVVEVKPVKVGVMMAFSGGSSSMGYGTMKGVELAKKRTRHTKHRNYSNRFKVRN